MTNFLKPTYAPTTVLPAVHAERESSLSRLEPFQAQIDALLNEQLDPKWLRAGLREAFRSGPEATRNLLQALTQTEGNLAEQAIGVCAQSNADLVVVRGTLNLPVTEAALELVDRNEPASLRCLAVSSDRRARRDYRPDLVIVDRKTGSAIVIEVKKSLGHYDNGRIDAMKRTMLAAALSLPDLSFKELRRLSIRDVTVAIVVADNKKSDTEQGVWPVSRIDELIGVAGAGKALEKVREQAKARINNAWSQVMREVEMSLPSAGAGNAPSEAAEVAPKDDDAFSDRDDSEGDASQVAGATIRFGFARGRPLAA